MKKRWFLGFDHSVAGSQRGPRSFTAVKAWADFDLYGEAERIPNEDSRAAYRTWLDNVIDEGSNEPLAASLPAQLISVLVATASWVSSAHSYFRGIHP